MNGSTLFLCCGLLFVSPLSAQVQPLLPGELRVVKYDGFEAQAHRSPDQLTLLYFWATWCGPCVRKIHHLEELRQSMKEKNLRIMLVSMDRIEQIQKVKELIKRKNLKAEAVLLDETSDYNALINAINPEWEGSIPYYMFVKKKKMIAFYEGSLSKEKLFAMVEDNL